MHVRATARAGGGGEGGYITMSRAALPRCAQAAPGTGLMNFFSFFFSSSRGQGWNGSPLMGWIGLFGGKG